MHFMNNSFVNLGDEVILTLLWQSGASESVTVSMLYLLLTVQMQRFACLVCMHALVCVCVCVWERESRVYSAPEIVLIAACVQTHTSIITVSVTQLCSPLGLELMVKLRILLTVFTLVLKAEARDYGKGSYISDSDAACGVRPITMHCASWPIRADCACRKEGLCRKRSVWERWGIEDLQ